MRDVGVDVMEQEIVRYERCDEPGCDYHGLELPMTMGPGDEFEPHYHEASLRQCGEVEVSLAFVPDWNEWTVSLLPRVPDVLVTAEAVELAGAMTEAARRAAELNEARRDRWDIAAL